MPDWLWPAPHAARSEQRDGRRALTRQHGGERLKSESGTLRQRGRGDLAADLRYAAYICRRHAAMLVAKEAGITTDYVRFQSVAGTRPIALADSSESSQARYGVRP